MTAKVDCFGSWYVCLCQLFSQQTFRRLLLRVEGWACYYDRHTHTVCLFVVISQRDCSQTNQLLWVSSLHCRCSASSLPQHRSFSTRSRIYTFIWSLHTDIHFKLILRKNGYTLHSCETSHLRICLCHCTLTINNTTLNWLQLNNGDRIWTVSRAELP